VASALILLLLGHNRFVDDERDHDVRDVREWTMLGAGLLDELWRNHFRPDSSARGMVADPVTADARAERIINGRATQGALSGSSRPSTREGRSSCSFEIGRGRA
jgi:hypothetical protein